MSRWYHDPGAMPGEPFSYLDAPFNQLEHASATVTEIDTNNPDYPWFLATLTSSCHDDGPEQEPLSQGFPTREEAEAWAEVLCPVPLPVIPVEIYPEIMIRERYRPEPGEVLISIQGSGEPPIVPHAPFAVTLRIEDPDLTRTIHHHTFGTLRPLTKDTATTIIHFVLRHRNRMRKLVIHCHAGVRRSPGVAIGLAEWLPTSPGITALIEAHPCFNRHIYRQLCEAGIRLNLIPT